MSFEFLTLDDVDLRHKTVFLRVDINSPVDKEGNVLSERRIRAVIPTLKELISSKVVLTSHQGRPGESDFASLVPHVRILRRNLGDRVKFVEDIMGPTAINTIRKLKTGEILVLENVRFCSEELLEGSPEELMKTHLMRKLSPLFDVFVNDAFAALHRAQPSLIALSAILPMVAGRLMEKELSVVKKLVTNPDRPMIAILGGSKIKDKVPAISALLRRGMADKVLVAGLVGEAFLKASGFRFEKTVESMLNRSVVMEAKRILRKYGDKVVLPVDVAWKENGERVEGTLRKGVRTKPMDVGKETTKLFSTHIREAGTIFAAGPLGVYEVAGFDISTKEILSEIANSNAFSVVGGGDLASTVDQMGLGGGISHLSTGGGALLYTISGVELPVLDALKKSALKRKRKPFS